LAYIKLSKEIQDAMKENGIYQSPFCCRDEDVIRRNMDRDKANVLRPAFLRDVEKIMNIPYYTRYCDKTQVFSLQKNDDISRRFYHVQLVSRIARNLGRALGLNLDLIEAIALGHDLGHTPFGHAGEKKLNEIYHARTGRYFNHNIQSARVLDTIFPVNLSLQTLDGIICHNGELELREYRPEPCDSFEDFDKKMQKCLNEKDGGKTLIPGTLEGCVVRVSDIIAYLGKDRQDAIKLGVLEDHALFTDLGIGKSNAEIINNMTVNLVENSYGKPYLKMDDEYFEAFSRAKKENYEMIYQADATEYLFEDEIYPMFEAIYEKLLSDLEAKDKTSVIYRHHMRYVENYATYYREQGLYEKEDADDIVVDAIASMTDDYFIDLYAHLFPDGKHKITYTGYFK